MRRSARALLVAAAAGLTASGCTEIENMMATVPALNFMREAPSFDPYEAPRVTPPNTVPLESPAGPYEAPLPGNGEAQLREYGAGLTNPLGRTDAVLEKGQAVYLNNCMPCHGAQGQGNGPVVGPGKYPLGPNLTIPTTVARSDGYLYAIIKGGRGLMPSYRRIPPMERWAVVSYLRYLQEGGQPVGAAAGSADAAATDTAQGGGQD